MNIPILTPIKFYATLVAFGLLLAVISTQTLRLTFSERRVAELKMVAAQEGERQANAVALAVQAERELETQRRAAQDKVIHDAETQAAKNLVDATAARIERDGMRHQLTAYVAASRQTRSDSAAPITSTSTRNPLDLLSELFSRADDRAGDLAIYADDLRTRLVACERSYDALTP